MGKLCHLKTPIKYSEIQKCLILKIVNVRTEFKTSYVLYCLEQVVS